ncbi:PEBP-like protein [Thozetella sp. PMI_491]|nr:PEBP-like protein [Thozetella sp. PMI_491]
MSRCQQVGRPIVRSLRQAHSPSAHQIQSIGGRPFSLSASRRDDGVTTTTSTTADGAPKKLMDDAVFRKLMDPNTTTMPWAEKKLEAMGTPPIGTRRRRAALRSSDNIPFEQLPYQCFQEARKILAADREDKIRKIVAEGEKIRRLEAADASTFRGGEAYKQKRLESLRREVEELKILADINDPEVKRRFEDGLGDMTKPIYRYLAEKKWRSMDYKIITQRISQFNIVPDLLAKFDPTIDVKLFYKGFGKVPPGTILDSRVTETPPSMSIQAFGGGDRLYTIAVIDSDVPDVEIDGFTKRLHYLATNVSFDPSKNGAPFALGKIGDTETSLPGSIAVPWLPAFSQKGAPYHRLSVFVMQQPAGAMLDAAQMAEIWGGEKRDKFSIKALRDKFGVDAVGYNIFRTVWDENTAGVMERHGIPGADFEFRPIKFKSLKTPRKAKGWEAKRQKPKYKSLWKYVKRIA